MARVPPGRWWGNHPGETRWVLEARAPEGRPGVARPRRAFRAATGAPWCSFPASSAGTTRSPRSPGGSRRIGYRPATLRVRHERRLLAERALERVERRVAALHARTGRRVAVVGHSRGGHFARAVAARRPDLVSHALSLGADLQAMFHCSELILLAVEGARRTAHATGLRAAPRVPHAALPVRVRARASPRRSPRTASGSRASTPRATAWCAGRPSSSRTPTASR